MAIAVDASSPVLAAQTSLSSTITTASFTPPAGSLVVAGAYCSQNAANITFTLSDSLAGSWTTDLLRNSASSGGYQSAAGIYHMIPTGGSAMTVTCVVGSSFYPTVKVYVLTGVDLASPVGTTGNQSSASTSFATTGYALARANSFAMFVAANNAANLVTSNDATASSNGPASNGHYGVAGYKLPAAAAGATNTHHLECSGTVGMHVVQVEFKAALPVSGYTDRWRRTRNGLLVR